MVSLIATLPCGQMDISQMAATGLKAMASSGNIEHKSLNEPYISKEEQQTLYSIFEQLVDSGVPIIGVPDQDSLAGVGRAARQKRVRRLIRSCANPTAVHIAAWAECFRHWEALNRRLNKPKKGSVNEARENNIVSGSSDVRQSAALLNLLLIPGQQDHWAEWQNTMLFLSSLGGSCILGRSPIPHSLSRWCQPEFLPSELKGPILSEDLVKRFIVTTVDMLVNEDIRMQETAKETLGSELHPKLYPLLLAQLDT